MKELANQSKKMSETHLRGLKKFATRFFTNFVMLLTKKVNNFVTYHLKDCKEVKLIWCLGGADRSVHDIQGPLYHVCICTRGFLETLLLHP